MGYKESHTNIYREHHQKASAFLLFIFFSIQLLLPWRYILYPGNIFWTEEGYRFAWRVMLMEKAGYTNFIVKDKNHRYGDHVDNYKYLTPYQIKMMSTQPDMILQYAHKLRDEYEKKGYLHPEVYAISYVSVNGSGSRLFLDSTRNLSLEKESFNHKTWIQNDRK